MSTGITFAKIVVAAVLIAVVVGVPTLLEVMRRHEISPRASAQGRIPLLPPPRPKLADKALRPGSGQALRPGSGQALPLVRPPAKNARGHAKGKSSARYDMDEVPAATVLPALLRAPLHSTTARVDDRVRAILRSAVKQSGWELVPAASTIYGKVLDVIPASRWQPKGRIVLGFYTIEHAGTGARIAISAKPLVFEPIDAMGNRRTVDVQVSAGELLHITLAEPLVIRLPK